MLWMENFPSSVVNAPYRVAAVSPGSRRVTCTRGSGAPLSEFVAIPSTAAVCAHAAGTGRKSKHRNALLRRTRLLRHWNFDVFDDPIAFVHLDLCCILEHSLQSVRFQTPRGRGHQSILPGMKASEAILLSGGRVRNVA